LGREKYFFVDVARIMTQPLLESEKGPYFYRSTRNALVQICKKEGITALYKGLGPSIIGVSHVVVQFPTYEKIKMILFGIHV
jgi:solute carrier family 25 (mitochondrial folate transporter), member 32